MPTKKPRLTITLDDHVYLLFKQFSEVQGRSMSSVINEVLSEISPPVARIMSTLIRAQSLPREVVEDMVLDLEEVAMEMDLRRQDYSDFIIGIMDNIKASGGLKGDVTPPV